MDVVEYKQLDRSKLEDRFVTFEYTSQGTYDLNIKKNEKGWNAEFILVKDRPMKKRLKEALITPYKGESILHGAFIENEEVGIIQFEYQEYNKSVRVWDLYVWSGNKRNGIGTSLMDICKKYAKEKKARRIILETQSSNLKAIAFYQKNEFELIGFDATSYTNKDVEKGEVRLELAYHLLK